MSRTPRPHRPAVGDQPSSLIIGDPPPVAPYPLQRGGRAVPDRTRTPDIGAACHDTRRVVPAPTSTDELREGELGTTTGNSEPMPKTSQEYGDSVRETRGVRIRPERPGGVRLMS
jgi:hypothetical protein